MALLQLFQPASQLLMTHAERTQSITALGFFSQARPQSEQFSTLMRRSVSQPFVWFESQSPNPASHTATAHDLNALQDATEALASWQGAQDSAPQP
jgi:hypothetical protein